MRWLPALSLVVTLLIVAAFTGGLVVMFMWRCGALAPP